MEKNELLMEITSYDRLDYGGVRLTVHSMDYPFYMARIFGREVHKESDFDTFKSYIFGLTFDYMKRWLWEREHERGDRDLHFIYNFQSDSNPRMRELFEEVYEKTGSSIVIPVGNLRLEMKRFGDGLGLKLSGNNGSNEVHVDGMRIFHDLSRNSTNTGFFQYIREFVYAIECTISLPRDCGVNNSAVIDFSKVYEKLRSVCPYVDWVPMKDFALGLTGEAYELEEEMFQVGLFHGSNLAIAAKLVHHLNSEGKKARQWRRGNVSDEGSGKFKFFDGKDLCLSLTVKCPFEQNTFLREMPRDINLGKLQQNLRLSGATLYAQLCAMQTQKYFVD